jgi:amino acid permease
MYKVTLGAFAIISVLCLSMGLLSYRVYGDKVADTILFNMPKGNLTMAIQAMYTVNILGSFIMNIQPIFGVFESNVEES